MSDFHRELCGEPSRCDACGRYVSECVAAPCEDAQESARMADARWCDLCGTPTLDCTTQCLYFRQDGQCVIGNVPEAHRVGNVCQTCYDEAIVL